MMSAEERPLSRELDDLVLTAKENAEEETVGAQEDSGNRTPPAMTPTEVGDVTPGEKEKEEAEVVNEEEEEEEEEDEEDDDEVDDLLGEDDFMEDLGDSPSEKDREESSSCRAVASEEPRDVQSSPGPPSKASGSSAGPTVTPSAASSDVTAEDASIYHVKWVQFNSKQLPIVTQNANGPCPLIAIANVLLLRQMIQLPHSAELVTSQQIVEYFGDHLLSADTKNLTPEQMANFQQNMNDAFVLFPKLQTGLDMNLRFSGVRDFEYTPELGIFDLFEIPIFHGWVVDPQEMQLAEIVRNCSYNQLVEKIINDKADECQDKVTRALLAEQFLELTASQLTYHGLCELNAAIKEGQLGVLFRNNHFNTLFKYKDALYLLVTDQGFLHETRVVWETLNDIDGDSRFLDSSFRPYQKPEPSSEAPSVSPDFVNTPAQVDSDYQLALSLFNEGPSEGRIDGLPPSTESDYALARRLQEEENSLAADMDRERQNLPATRVPRSASQPSHPPPPPANPSHPRQRTVSQSRGRGNGDSCILL